MNPVTPEIPPGPSREALQSRVRCLEELLALMESTTLEQTQKLESLVEELETARNDLEKRVEERTRELLAAQDAVLLANRARTTFLGNLSHEMNTPLHGLLGNCEIALDDVASKDYSSLALNLQTIQRCGERLHGLLDNLLTLSRLESAKAQLKLVPTEPLGLLLPAVDTLKELLAAKNITLKFLPPEGLPPILADKEEMVRVFATLLSNIFKFCPKGSTAEITITHGPTTIGEFTGKGVEFRFQDQGPGIPEGELEKIFEPLFKSSRIIDGQGGNGLGLAIARGILRRHQGWIRAQNNPQGGATFIVILPVSPS